jgi:hypothetical protein
MTTYKITRRPEDKAEKYYTDLMKAMNKKEYLKKLLKGKGGDMFHIFGSYPNKDGWFKLE